MQATTRDISSIVFSGPVHEGSISPLISNIEGWLNQKRERTHIKKKIITISIEFLHNIISHSFGMEGALFVKKNVNVYTVSAESWIETEKLAGFMELVGKINRYTGVQLKSEIEQKLKVSTIFNKKGAGIGLHYVKEIIAGTIRLHEKEHKHDKIRICLEADIDRHFSKRAYSSSMSNLQLTDASLYYAGDMNHSTIGALVFEIDKWLRAKEENIIVKRKVVTSCIEILQNVGKHSDKKNGFIVLNSDSDFYEAGIGSFISKQQAENISWEVEKVKFYSKGEIYQKTNDKLNTMGTGLGILNVAALTNKNLSIDFKSLTNEDLLMVFNFKVERYKEGKE